MVLLLTAMTLITFAYVALTNLYGLCYDLADKWPSMADELFAIGDYLLGLAQDMTWSVAATTALFAWLIFLGIAYAVRVHAHIGVDLLVRLFPPALRKTFAVLSALIFMAYAALLLGSSMSWIGKLMSVNIGAEDLDQFGIKEWQVAIVVPVGLALVIARLIEALVGILRGDRLELESVEDTAALSARSTPGTDEARHGPAHTPADDSSRDAVIR